MINNFFRPAVVLNGQGSHAEIHHTTVTITESELLRANGPGYEFRRRPLRARLIVACSAE
ncbi:hypothetical protein G3M58_93125 [Streptomyces sp. SID7499]|uniref:Uncharacterized protein n=1 Tax=Streptomyces sp. SID7499 TaxID=2706086 RepID=A0A6G3XYU0_9ACTN|nr:hypothetical protein [Streptomyces sp. SID7499]